MRFRISSCPALLLIGLLSLAGHARAAEADGPYVLAAADGWTVRSLAQDSGQVQAREETLARDARVRVPAVGAVPAFEVQLRPPAADAADELRVPAKQPLFVVADTHGEYEILVAMLRAQGLLDAALRWTYGRGHLVVLGDVFDRGPNHLEIFWLLYELQAQAERAGGGVHLVLGNHEAMVLTGDLRYLHAKYRVTEQALGLGPYSRLFAADTVLGQWLRSRPAMLKVNDLLCLHAGVSRALLDSQLSLADVNQVVRAALRGEPGQGAMAELVLGSNGPLWYRGYFPGQAGFLPATAADVEATLQRFGVRRILVGHTIVPDVTPLFDGKVVAVQVYPTREADGGVHFESLLIRDGKLWQAGVDGSLRALSKPR